MLRRQWQYRPEDRPNGRRDRWICFQPRHSPCRYRSCSFRGYARTGAIPSGAVLRISSPDPPQYTPLITEALRYLDAHYSENDTSVSLLAKHLHISTTYLRNCFLKELSVTPKAYLTSLRMTSAQSLLSTGYYSVSSVAEQVGFGDAKNFAVAYKKHFGYPPSAQRYQDFL